MKKAILPLIILTSLLASCGQQTVVNSNPTNQEYANGFNTENPNLESFMQSIGGEKNFLSFFADNKDDIQLIQNRLSQSGIGLKVNDDSKLTAQNVESCDKYFPPEDRNKVHLNFIGQYLMVVFIDNSGRPVVSAKTMPLGYLGNTQNRQPGCQRQIGNLFSNVSQPQYVGGHLIADFLGGYGGRANVVPQNTDLNGGLWKRAELKIESCAAARNTISMNVAVTYPDAVSIVPKQFHMAVQVTPLNVFKRGTFLALNLDNTATGDTPGTIGPSGVSKVEAFKKDMDKACF